jgi:hypothetical protein
MGRLKGGSSTVELQVRGQISALARKCEQCGREELNLQASGGRVTAVWARRCPAPTYPSSRVRPRGHPLPSARRNGAGVDYEAHPWRCSPIAMAWAPRISSGSQPTHDSNARPSNTRLPRRHALEWQHASRINPHPPTPGQQASTRPNRTPNATKAAWGTRAAFACVRIDDCSCRLWPILRVPEPRCQARAQDEGATAPMGKLLADLRALHAFTGRPPRDARPQNRHGRLRGELVLGAIERHQFLSAAMCTSLRRDAQEKVWGRAHIFDFSSSPPSTHIGRREAPPAPSQSRLLRVS